MIERGNAVRRFAIRQAREILEAVGVIYPQIEIPTVNIELYNRTRKAVEQAGYNFIVPIRTVSIKTLLIEDEQREQRRRQRRFDYVNDSKTMRATISPEMEVAINPARFKIMESDSLPTDEQKKKIKQEQAMLRRQVPSDIQHFVNLILKWLDPSTLSQLEDAYMDRTGNLLFPDYFARTDVQTVRGRVAVVGRRNPLDQRVVDDWNRGNVLGGVFAVRVLVLPRKLAA